MPGQEPQWFDLPKEVVMEVLLIQTASTQFIRYWQREAKAGRTVPTGWGRIVPPISASMMEVFHQEMQDFCLNPNFFPQPLPWITDAVTEASHANNAVFVDRSLLPKLRRKTSKNR